MLVMLCCKMVKGGDRHDMISTGANSVSTTQVCGTLQTLVPAPSLYSSGRCYLSPAMTCLLETLQGWSCYPSYGNQCQLPRSM
jgi:hypothetical protein